MNSAPPHRRWPDIAAAVLVAASVLSHVLYLVLDARFPRDLSLFHAELRDIHAALGAPATWPQALAVLVEPGGGYELFIAVWLRLVGRSPHAIQLLDLLWITAVLVLVLVIARQLAGPVAGAIAAAIAGAFPMFILLARLSWIHIPETALVLGATSAWIADPGLRRRHSVVLLGLLGAAALLMRHSGLLWFGSLGVALVVAAARRRSGTAPSWKVVSILGVVWLVASIPVLLDLATYVGAKLDSRATYVETVPSFGNQVISGLGPMATALAVVGAALALWPPHRKFTALLVVWAALPLALYPVFHAGLDNFLVAPAALAILAGVGLSVWPRASTSIAAVVLVLYLLPQWLPAPAKGTRPAHMIGRSAAMLGLAANPSIRNHFRAYEAFGGDDVVALIDASCEGHDPCLIAVDQGLFLPYGEEPGEFELFLARRDDVELRVLARTNGVLYGGEEIVALAHFDCRVFDTQWRQRYPDSMSLWHEVVDARALEPAWSRLLEERCAYVWFTPGGQVARPDLLPGPSDTMVGHAPMYRDLRAR